MSKSKKANLGLVLTGTLVGASVIPVPAMAVNPVDTYVVDDCSNSSELIAAFQSAGQDPDLDKIDLRCSPTLNQVIETDQSVVIDGNGNVLNFALGGKLVAENDVTLTDLTISGVSDGEMIYQYFGSNLTFEEVDFTNITLANAGSKILESRIGNNLTLKDTTFTLISTIENGTNLLHIESTDTDINGAVFTNLELEGSGSILYVHNSDVSLNDVGIYITQQTFTGYQSMFTAAGSDISISNSRFDAILFGLGMTPTIGFWGYDNTIEVQNTAFVGLYISMIAWGESHVKASMNTFLYSYTGIAMEYDNGPISSIKLFGNVFYVRANSLPAENTLVDYGYNFCGPYGIISCNIPDALPLVEAPISVPFIPPADYSEYVVSLAFDGEMPFHNAIPQTAWTSEVSAVFGSIPQTDLSGFPRAGNLDAGAFEFRTDQFVVSFVTNGAEAETLPDQVYRLGDDALRLPKPQRSGYDFIGWFTEPEGGERVANNYVPEASISLYAHWKKKAPVVRESFEVKFDVLGGEAVADFTFVEGSFAIDLPIPVRSGFEFLGWVLAGTSTQVASPYIPASNVTLQAQWKELPRAEQTQTVKIKFPTGRTTLTVVARGLLQQAITDLPAGARIESIQLGIQSSDSKNSISKIRLNKVRKFLRQLDYDGKFEIVGNSDAQTAKNPKQIFTVTIKYSLEQK